MKKDMDITVNLIDIRNKDWEEDNQILKANQMIILIGRALDDSRFVLGFGKIDDQGFIIQNENDLDFKNIDYILPLENLTNALADSFGGFMSRLEKRIIALETVMKINNT